MSMADPKPDSEQKFDGTLDADDSSGNFYADLATNSDQPTVMPHPDKPMPSWVREQIEGLESMAAERQLAELELRLPGVTEVFGELIASLPDPHEGNLEFPVSAYVVRRGESGRVEVISRAQNRTNSHNDSMAHAEMEAMREAEEKLGTKHLDDCFLLSTLEPCVMCCGGIENTNVGGVIYGAKHEDVEGAHVLVAGEYKPYRTSPDTFDAEAYLKSNPSRYVWAGFMRGEAVQKLRRDWASWNSYFRDPDSKY